MSSLWGWTQIVLEGNAANYVYSLLCRAKEECVSEERDHCSEVIHTAKGDFCFAFGLKDIYEDSEDDYWGRAVKETVLVDNVFMLFAYPFDRTSRYLLNAGNIEYEYDGNVLRINEDTYADEGMMLPLLYAMLGEECKGLYFRISSEADYIGQTNDSEGKYFRLEEYEENDLY
jgi:hypothetical protein